MWSSKATNGPMLQGLSGGRPVPGTRSPTHRFREREGSVSLNSMLPETMRHAGRPISLGVTNGCVRAEVWSRIPGQKSSLKSGKENPRCLSSRLSEPDNGGDMPFS